MENLLPANGLSLLAGTPKAGKSTLARNLAVEVVRGGGKWLGKDVKQGTVVHLSLEERMETIRKHYKQLDALGEHIYLLTETHPRPPNLIQWLQNAIERYKPSLDNCCQSIPLRLPSVLTSIRYHRRAGFIHARGGVIFSLFRVSAIVAQDMPCDRRSRIRWMAFRSMYGVYFFPVTTGERSPERPICVRWRRSDERLVVVSITVFSAS